MGTTRRAAFVFCEFESSKTHFKRIEDEQPPDERLADTRDKLHRFSCLDKTDDAGKNAEHASIRA